MRENFFSMDSHPILYLCRLEHILKVSSALEQFVATYFILETTDSDFSLEWLERRSLIEELECSTLSERRCTRFGVASNCFDFFLFFCICTFYTT
jgi:hypothetical protein